MATRLFSIFFSVSLIAVTLVLPANAVQSILDGVYSEDQAERGRELYNTYCSGCHGDKLQGGGDFFPSLSGTTFTANWRSQSLGDIFYFITEFMPFDMPGALEAQYYADSLAYILKFNGYPAGDKELLPDRELLKKIRFISIPRD